MKTSVSVQKKKSAEMKAKQMSPQKILSFFGDVKEELKKVSWTPQQELLLNTKVVLIATFLSGLIIYLADYTMMQILTLISTIVKYILGLR